MKICKNCKKQIEDDALVCPHCGCVNKNVSLNNEQKTEPIVRNQGSGEPQKKKRKTWLWVIGWIFAFPIPLTVLILRNQKLNKILKVIIVAIAWLIYLFIIFPSGGTDKGTSGSTSNIKKLEFTNTKDITVRVGESDSKGYLKVSVKKKDEFVPDDVVFVSDRCTVSSRAIICAAFSADGQAGLFLTAAFAFSVSCCSCAIIAQCPCEITVGVSFRVCESAVLTVLTVIVAIIY